MIRINLIVVTLLQLMNFGVGNCQADKDAPKLTILIGLDQFRASYLIEYNEAFVGGFRRIIDNGLWYQNAIVDHAPTLSLPGHTTLATGANPRTHGITSNAWIDLKQEPDSNGMLHGSNAHVDQNVKPVGGDDSYSFSPYKIKVEGLADWFRKADSNARTVALSVSELAVLYGGKFNGPNSNNHVYWLGSTGKFVTSTYYRDNYPVWLKKFNSSIEIKYANKHSWENTVPAKFQKLASPDDAAYEFDGVNTTFPHKAEDMIPEINEKYYDWWFGRFNPTQNEALFDLAKESINQLRLGQRTSSDFMSLAIKLTDRIGHDFGPRSLEQLDVILRLDRLIGDFLDYLDRVIGKDNYVIVISADHGAPNVSEFEESQGRASKRISSLTIEKALIDVEELIKDYSGEEKYLPELIARKLEKNSFIAKAMTRSDLQDNDTEDPYIHAYRNSFLVDQATTYPLWTTKNSFGNVVSKYHPANYGVIVDTSYGANIWSAASTHGGSHQYDREVPILFMGKNIRPGIAKEKAYTRDIAPTLAKIAGIKFSESVDGRVLDLK